MNTVKMAPLQRGIKRIPLIAVMAMAVLSFTNLLGLSISEACIFVGVGFFFIDKAIERQPMSGSGLDMKAIGTNLKDRKLWLLPTQWLL